MVTMSSDLHAVEFIADQCGFAGRWAHRRMFGEYALYLDGKVVAFVCDNRLYVKPTDVGRAVLGAPVEAFPYPGARPHFLLEEELEHPALLRQVFEVTAAALALPKPRPTRPGKKPHATGGRTHTRSTG